MQTSAKRSADCCMLGWNVFHCWVHWACPNLRFHSAHIW